MAEVRKKSSNINPLAVSPSEGARLAGVGRTKFYEALGRGEIASFKFGARRLIRVAAIEDWLRRREALAREGR